MNQTSKRIDKYLKKQNIESKVVSFTQLYIQGLGEVLMHFLAALRFYGDFILRL